MDITHTQKGQEIYAPTAAEAKWFLSHLVTSYGSACFFFLFLFSSVIATQGRSYVRCYRILFCRTHFIVTEDKQKRKVYQIISLLYANILYMPAVSFKK